MWYKVSSKPKWCRPKVQWNNKQQTTQRTIAIKHNRIEPWPIAWSNLQSSNYYHPEMFVCEKEREIEHKSAFGLQQTLHAMGSTNVHLTFLVNIMYIINWYLASIDILFSFSDWFESKRFWLNARLLPLNSGDKLTHTHTHTHETWLHDIWFDFIYFIVQQINHLWQRLV